MECLQGESGVFRAVIIAEDGERVRGLGSELGQRGFICSVATAVEGAALADTLACRPDLALVAMDGAASRSRMARVVESVKGQLPVIALLSADAPRGLDPALVVDDFAVWPWDAAEVALRAERLLRRSGSDGAGPVRYGDLAIDVARCEVSLCGRPVPLTFREYELLRFLAANRGIVFTRQALLDRVWGYDYYGGERTVDVHIRRLRGKIEGPSHAFIDTVRNVGYRFRDDR